MGGRKAWIGPELSYTMLMRVAEVFAERDGRVYPVNCLRVEDVAFMRASVW